MKQLTFIVFISFACIQIKAQYLHRSVIGAAGMISSNGNVQLSSTTGEVATQSLNSADLRITQGFQQGSAKMMMTLNLTLFLQGYYDASGIMRPVLLNQGQSSDASITDSISVELHPALTPNLVAAQTNALLHTNGNAVCQLLVKPGNYYIVVKHRNHIETWSANPVALAVASTAYNFSTIANAAYGNNQAETEPGKFAFYAGDINQNENIDLLDIALQELSINNFEFGYKATDMNGDGNVDLLDGQLVEANVNGFIYSVHP
jgi:hypothetical protein